MLVLSLRGVLFTLCVGVLFFTACATSAPASRTETDRSRIEGDPGVVHVHGLGINPKDGALYAATHTGVFRIPEPGSGERAERIADRYQDTMGFTVVRPDHFLGSGHPDMREYRAGRLPANLGLIESTDAGRTWQPLSLLGEADFHALRAVHGRIYGYDATGNAFMVSADGKTWDTRARLLMYDFAVDPSDPELIVAALANDVRLSRDGGRSWEPVIAPPLVLLAWQVQDLLWGLGPSGTLYRSADGGVSWEQRGAVRGAPEALLATADALYVAVHEDGIYVSRDGGASWQLRYREPA